MASLAAVGGGQSAGFLLMDLHTHTAASDGQGSVRDVLQAAAARGLSAVAVTDHFMDERRPAISESRLLALVRVARRHPLPGYPVLLAGAEVEAHTEIPAALARRLDVLIRSVHSIPGAPEALWAAERWERYKEGIIRAIQMPHTTILGHVEGYLPLPVGVGENTTFAERRALEREVARRFFDEAFQEAVAGAAKAAGVAVELHVATQTPRPGFVRRLVRAGAYLSVGSDAHAPDRVGDVTWAYELIRELGVPKELLYVPPRLQPARHPVETRGGQAAC